MSNFGIGFGAFMQGVQGGMNTMQGLKRAQTQQDLADMQLQDMKDQRTAQQGFKDASAQGMTEAKANTDGQLDNVMAYYMKNTAPKLQQYWLSQGDPQKADAFGKWIQDSQFKQRDGLRIRLVTVVVNHACLRGQLNPIRRGAGGGGSRSCKRR